MSARAFDLVLGIVAIVWLCLLLFVVLLLLNSSIVLLVVAV